MEDLNDMVWTQLFQDKPISRDALTQMQMNIMDQIMADPIDFQYQQELMIRRRWGILLGISIFLTILCLGAFFWFQGDLVLKLFNFNYWKGVFSNLSLFKFEIYYLWHEISLPIMGLLCVLVTYRSAWKRESV